MFMSKSRLSTHQLFQPCWSERTVLLFFLVENGADLYTAGKKVQKYLDILGNTHFHSCAENWRRRLITIPRLSDWYETHSLVQHKDWMYCQLRSWHNVIRVHRKALTRAVGQRERATWLELGFFILGLHVFNSSRYLKRNNINQTMDEDAEIIENCHFSCGLFFFSFFFKDDPKRSAA